MPVQSGDIIRVAARHFFENVDEQINVFHFTVQSHPDPANDNALLEDVSQKLSIAYGHIDEYMTSALVAVDITVYNVTDDYPVGVTNWTTPYVGGGATGDGLPPGTSALMLWRTGTKNVLGKTYLPTFAEAYQNRGTLTAGALTSMGDFGDEMLETSMYDNGYAFVFIVYSRQAGLARPIISRRAASKIAYQRRRKAGVGS